jgi:hypothetical protein
MLLVGRLCCLHCCVYSLDNESLPSSKGLVCSRVGRMEVGGNVIYYAAARPGKRSQQVLEKVYIE